MDLKTLRDLQDLCKEQDQDWSYKGIWKEFPVDFITFCREWLGEGLFEGPQEDFSYNVLGTPHKDRVWETNFNTALLAWGKGSGKDALSSKLLTYAAYLLLNMRNPRDYFNIGKTSPIHMLNISYNSTQAKQVFFNGYLIPSVLNCINPRTGNNFFAEHGVDLRVNEGDILSREIHFERPTGPGEGGIIATSLGGDKATAEGYSPLIVFVDEYSAMQNPVKAEKLVEDLEKSAASRFSDQYKLIYASFKRGRNCLMSLKVDECEKNDTEGVYISKKATWEVNKLKKKDDFKRMYKNNPVTAARTYEFSEVEGLDEGVFFKLQDRLQACFTDSGKNPFIGDVISCRSDQLDILEFKEWVQPKYQVHYHVHIDLAKGKGTDRAALAITHKEGLESFKDGELQKYIIGELVDKNFKVLTDMILQITASKQGEIIIEDIRLFVIKLWNKGYKLKVTIDGFQSMDFIQQLKNKGIECELLSVDRNKTPYDTLQSIIYRGDFECYHHPYLLRELEELEESEDGKKVDHPMKSIRRAKEEGVDAGCFVGETRIPLLNGKIVMIKDLVGKEVWVYSCTKDGKVVPGKARGRYTKSIKKVVDVILDNGATVRCTPDHRFMLRDGTYKQAKDLTREDRIMPLRRVLKDKNYEQVAAIEKYPRLTHHIVMENIKGTKVRKEQVVHHLDHNRLNNSPENLEITSRKKHSSYHTKFRRAHEKGYDKKVREVLSEYKIDENWREKHLNGIKRHIASKDYEWFVKRARNNPIFRKDITLNKLNKYKDYESMHKVSLKLKCDRKVILRVLKENDYINWENFKKDIKGHNHRVKMVEKITLDEPIKVYDLEVDKWHNFALEVGVFVHNSKDLADAICGSVLKSLLSDGPVIPIMPGKGISEYRGNENENDMAQFERDLMGGNIAVDKKGKPIHSEWENLLPSRG